jgi:hypothetical protein
MNWKRVIGWSLLMLVAINIIGTLITMAHSKIDPAMAAKNHMYFGLILKISIATISIFCYWRLGAGTQRYRAAHVLAAFVLAEIATIGIIIFNDLSYIDIIDPWPLLRSIIYALVGYLLARLMPNKSFKSDPIHESA